MSELAKGRIASGGMEIPTIALAGQAQANGRNPILSGDVALVYYGNTNGVTFTEWNDVVAYADFSKFKIITVILAGVSTTSSADVLAINIGEEISVDNLNSVPKVRYTTSVYLDEDGYIRIRIMERNLDTGEEYQGSLSAMTYFVVALK